MKLGHIVKYHDVFFDNDPYRTMFSGVMTLFSFKFINLDVVRSINPVKLITTMLDTKMSFSSLKMVYLLS